MIWEKAYAFYHDFAQLDAAQRRSKRLKLALFCSAPDNSAPTVSSTKFVHKILKVVYVNSSFSL